MKRLISVLFIMLFALNMSAAEGWPAKYEGVMLQGFYWDSYSESSWTNLTAQADTLSKYFKLIWVPNSAYCGKGSQMGYTPIYWFYHISSFGTPKQLKEMIATYKEHGTGIIEDVVINHRSGNTGWCDFPEESYNGTTYTWSLADICKNDECTANGYEATGAYDTGDNFDGSRDLDHTSSHVQTCVKAYLDYLLNYLGYAGFRYDMVKGYGATYTKIYNESANPTFSVGEYWDGSYQTVCNWINSTGKTSAAFDYPLKYRINEAFGNSNWSALSDKGIAGDSGESGMCRYAVTFVDNHDTGQDSNNDKLWNNVLAANAFILAMPGTPCIYLPHWKQYKDEIGKMILARNAAGVNNQSAITSQGTQGSGYVMKTQGTKGSILFIAGYVENADVTGYKLISTGDNYAFFVSNNVEVDLGSKIKGIGDANEDETLNVADVTTIVDNILGKSEATNADANGDGAVNVADVTSVVDMILGRSPLQYVNGKLFCYFEADDADYSSPNVWIWNASNSNYNFTGGTWPGQQMTYVGDAANGNKIYRWEGPAVDSSNMPTGIVLSTGTGSPQTPDYTFMNGGYYTTKGLAKKIVK